MGWQSSREYLDNLGLTHLQEGDIGAGYSFQWRHSGTEYVNCNTDYSGQGVDQINGSINLVCVHGNFSFSLRKFESRFHGWVPKEHVLRTGIWKINILINIFKMLITILRNYIFICICFC